MAACLQHRVSALQGGSLRMCQALGRPLDVFDAAAQRQQQVDRGFGCVVGERAGHRRHQVRQLGAQLVEWWRARQCLGPAHSPGAQPGAPMARFGGVEPSGGVFADRRVQAEAQGFIGAGVGVNQRVRHQLVEQQLGVESFIGNERGGRAGGEAVGEHRQRREQPRLRRTEQFPAPLDDTLHRGVARIERTARAAARQQIEPRRAGAAQAREHVGRRDAAHARGGQLDCERHAVERAHQLDQHRAVACAEVEVGPHRACALDEERDRRVARGMAGIGAGGRQVERSGRQLAFAVEAERTPRSDDDMQRFDDKAAKAAWQRTLALFNSTLRG